MFDRLLRYSWGSYFSYRSSHHVCVQSYLATDSAFNKFKTFSVQNYNLRVVIKTKSKRYINVVCRMKRLTTIWDWCVCVCRLHPFTSYVDARGCPVWRIRRYCKRLCRKDRNVPGNWLNTRRKYCYEQILNSFFLNLKVYCRVFPKQQKRCVHWTNLVYD